MQIDIGIHPNFLGIINLDTSQHPPKIKIDHHNISLDGERGKIAFSFIAWKPITIPKSQGG